MICQNCKANLQGDFKFCPSCGASVAQKGFCPGCGKETEASWLACPYCGQKFNNPSAQVLPQQHTIYEPKHGNYHGSSSGRLFGGQGGKHPRRKGFLGGLFSS
jgi:hypothetical protein